MEAGYRRQQQRRDARQLLWLAAGTAVFFLSFAFLDHARFGFGAAFWWLLGVRLMAAGGLMALGWQVNARPSRAASGVCASAGEVLLLGALLVVAWVYPAGDLGLQAQAMTLFVLAVYLVAPNRWIYGAAVAVSGSAALLAMAAVRVPGDVQNLYPVGGLLAFANVIGAFSSFRLQALRRYQFQGLHAQDAQTHELRLLADTDALTHLLNRRRFFSAAAARLAAARSQGQPCSVLFFDIDHFKAVNDEYGHSAGDNCLRHVAALCRAFFRGNDLVARIGGEEFGVFLDGADESTAMTLAERLRSEVERSAPPAPLPRTPTVTIGVAECTYGDRGVALALQRADVAMYLGKRSGRNRVVSAPRQPSPDAAEIDAAPTRPEREYRDREHSR